MSMNFIMNSNVKSYLGWSEFFGSDYEWDCLVERFDHKNIYQTSFHKKHFELLGWKVRRFIFKQDVKVVCLFQARVKKVLPAFYVFSVLGGALGDNLKLLELNQLNTWGIKYFHMRFFSMEPYDEAIKYKLIEGGVHFFQTLGLSGLSAKLDLSTSLVDFNRGFNRNWRRSLKFAREHKIEVDVYSDIDVIELIRLYRELESIKGLTITFSNKELLALIEAYKSNLVILCCKEKDTKNIIAIRGALVFKDYALDYLAATSNVGRDLKASFLLTYEYLIYLRSIGIRHFDFSGVNPELGVGVYQFKLGTGAKLIRYMGEFEISSSETIFFIVNLIWKTKENIQILKRRIFK